MEYANLIQQITPTIRRKATRPLHGRTLSFFFFYQQKAPPPFNFAHMVPHRLPSCLTCPLFFLERQTLWLIGSGMLCNDFALCGERRGKITFHFFWHHSSDRMNSRGAVHASAPRPAKTAGKQKAAGRSHWSAVGTFRRVCCVCTHLSYCVFGCVKSNLARGLHSARPECYGCGESFPLSKRKQTISISPVRQWGGEPLRSRRQNSI